MATHPHWQKHLSLSSAGFGEDELGALYEVLYPVRNSYKSFGLQIGVKKSEIESIEAKQTDPGGRLLEVLSVRVKKTETLHSEDECKRKAGATEISKTKIWKKVMPERSIYYLTHGKRNVKSGRIRI